ncbi:hypothetical protein GOC73_25090 [Sinorhizobium medicae]|nr:hypothetical protein [Sinorhizobium medicae]MDX0691328.1 hypothetical protein [Sinorhizobium medicae]
MCLRGPEPFALADKLDEMAPLIRSFLDHKVAKLKSMGFLHQSKAGSGSLHEGRSLTIVMHFVKCPTLPSGFSHAYPQRSSVSSSVWPASPVAGALLPMSGD